MEKAYAELTDHSRALDDEFRRLHSAYAALLTEYHRLLNHRADSPPAPGAAAADADV